MMCFSSMRVITGKREPANFLNRIKANNCYFLIS
uniref:Uncharacterized protein n=1 Tax=Anguilla anguilla TaxID=7936 RepID=A0A0E9V005_ANGAN